MSRACARWAATPLCPPWHHTLPRRHLSRAPVAAARSSSACVTCGVCSAKTTTSPSSRQVCEHNSNQTRTAASSCIQPMPNSGDNIHWQQRKKCVNTCFRHAGSSRLAAPLAAGNVLWTCLRGSCKAVGTTMYGDRDCSGTVPDQHRSTLPPYIAATAAVQVPRTCVITIYSVCCKACFSKACGSLLLGKGQRCCSASCHSPRRWKAFPSQHQQWPQPLGAWCLHWGLHLLHTYMVCCHWQQWDFAVLQL